MSKLDQLSNYSEELAPTTVSDYTLQQAKQRQQDNGAKLFPVRLSMLIGITTIAMLKAYFVVLGILDFVVGMYGLLVISLVFAAFFLSYTKYVDPSRNKTNVKHNNDKHLSPLFPSICATPIEPFVSIIIPVYNEQGLIRETVESCLKARYPPNKVETILVNDGSTDGTAALLDSIQRKYLDRVKVVHLANNMGKRKAMREGIIQGKAFGDIIVLVDSDSTMDEYALKKLVEAFSDPNVGAVTGHGRVRNAEQNTLTKIQDTWYDGQFSILKGMESSLDSVSCCSGILSAYRREAIMPCLDHWCNDKFLGVEFKPGDDRHLTSYVLGGTHHYIGSEHKVWKVKYSATAITYTEVPSKFRQLINQQIRWKKSWVRMFCFNLPFYFRYRPGPASYIYYVQTILSFISPIVAFRSLVWLPLEGDFINAVIYLSGIFFIGTLFAVEFKLRNPSSGNRWLYRLLMPFLAIGVLNNLIYYALLTIRSRSWLTR